MVDWERVGRLRSKGVDWDEIAEDEKVHFTPPKGVEDAGKALKALYYSKRSRGQGSRGKEVEKEALMVRVKRALIPAGLAVAIIGAIWFAFADYTSLVGVFLPAYPGVLLVAVAGIVILAIGMVLGTSRLGEGWKKPVAFGIVVGLVLSGGLALLAIGLGLPNLTPAYAEPASIGHGWQGTHNQKMWLSGEGLPVLFFYGSLACPFCGASSWAIYRALQDFGTFSSSPACSSSNPGDEYPDTPELNLGAMTYTSDYIAVDMKEGQDNQAISTPGLSLYEEAYVHYYDSGGYLPLYVIGGVWIQNSAIVDPSVFHSSTYSQPLYTCSQVLSILQNPGSNPTVSNAIVNQGSNYVEAFLCAACYRAGIAPPPSVTSNHAVMDIEASID
jgi:hypothetical protein